MNDAKEEKKVNPENDEDPANENDDDAINKGAEDLDHDDNDANDDDDDGDDSDDEADKDEGEDPNDAKTDGTIIDNIHQVNFQAFIEI